MNVVLILTDGRCIRKCVRRILFEFDYKKCCYFLRILDFEYTWFDYVFDNVVSFYINY